jgi:DNA-binding LacI/PurR family transcriptional regulator
MRSGDIRDPLPGTRAWSEQLGVARNTLAAALHSLAREQLVVIGPRGAKLKVGRRFREASGIQQEVRVLLHTSDIPNGFLQIDWAAAFADRLHRRGILLSAESCDGGRLEKYAAQPSSTRELLVLVSLPASYQRRFAAARRPVILVGEPVSGLNLAFISVDLKALVRHAALTLLRRGHSRILLLIENTRLVGIHQVESAFKQTCEAWSQTTVRRQIVRFPLKRDAMVAAACSLMSRNRERCGMILWEDIPPSLIMTAAMAHDYAVPEDIEIVSVLPSPEARMVYPPPLCYPAPAEAFARHLANAAIRYFESGKAPSLRKRLLVEPE